MGDGQEARKTSSMVGLAATALVGGVVALGVSWLDPLGGKAGTEHAGEVEPKPDDHGKDLHARTGHDPGGTSVITALDPLVISLAETTPSRRAPRLRVGVAIETDAGTADRTQHEAPRLRDGFTAAVRELGAEALSAPGGLEALRAALLMRARAVLGEEAVSGVLITDYVMS